MTPFPIPQSIERFRTPLIFTPPGRTSGSNGVSLYTIKDLVSGQRSRDDLQGFLTPISCNRNLDVDIEMTYNIRERRLQWHCSDFSTVHWTNFFIFNDFRNCHCPLTTFTCLCYWVTKVSSLFVYYEVIKRELNRRHIRVSVWWKTKN